MLWLDVLGWLLVVVSLTGRVLNIVRIRACFYAWGIANLGWCGIDIYYGIYSQAVLQFLYFGLAVWGLFVWKGHK